MRATYAMWRAGQLDQTESVYSQSLAQLRRDRAQAGRPLRLDGAKLPDYEAVAKYLGPLGVQVINHPEGWDAVGFVLPK